MKKTNFTNLKLVKNWLLVVAMFITTFSATQMNAQCQLNADDHIHVILSDDNCDAMLMQQMFLSDDGAKCADADHYEFEVRSEDGSTVLIPMTETAIVDETFIGGPYMLIIQAHDAAHVILNTAMLTFDVADKMPPIIDCPPATDTVSIQCYEQESYTLPVDDNCSVANIIKTNEVITDNDCSVLAGMPADVFRTIDRTYVAVDASGNQSAPCTVHFQVKRLTDIEFYGIPGVVEPMIKFPDDLVKAHYNAIQCSDADANKDADGNFDPNKTGWPFLVYPDQNITAAELAAGNITDTVELNNSCTFACNIASTYTDVKVNTCPDCIEKVVRFWTVVENSCQYPERFYPNIQTIEIVDTIDPVVVCPADRVITTNTVATFPPSSYGELDCGAMFTFPAPQMSDECQDYLTWSISVVNDMGTPIVFADTAETHHSVTRALPLGINTVTYIVYDNCGNSTECSWEVDVQDLTAPVAVCQQNTAVSLTYDGEAQIFAASFDSGSYDDCQIDHFGVRRMDNKIDCDGHVDTNADHFFEYVTFCCSDIVDNDITVIMRVWDKGGRYNDCMVQVNVQDKLPPQITCPPSICVECEYPFVKDKAGLAEAFGTVVQGYDNIETHTIQGDWGSLYNTKYDECYDNAENFKFSDGWSHDNCNLVIEDDFTDYRNQCNSGNIVRRFTAEDPNGTATCTQTIHFYNPDPFNYGYPEHEDSLDIIWPKDVTMTGCANSSDIAYGPDATGWPLLDEDNCDLVASNYRDDVFHFNDDNFDAEGVCFKIIRHWTVMDWCQRYPDDYFDHALAGKFYTWSWDQVIMISETDAPYFLSDCEDKENCTYDVNCEDGPIELTMTAGDACTEDDNLSWRYQIYINYNELTGSFDKLIDSRYFAGNASIIRGATVSASGDYPIGKHRIVWTVWDQCGNRAVCDKFFTVKNCKKPTPICVDHIVVEMMPVDTDGDGDADWAMIDVDARLVESCCTKSYHPCGYPLLYSFTADTTDTQRTYDCDSKGLQRVEMWVTALMPDGTTTQDYCITKIDFQDNNNVCPDIPSPMINVSGTVSTILDQPIPNVKVELQGSEVAVQNTTDNGAFVFNVTSEKSYDLVPSKDKHDLAGVSTLDIVLIQKHLLGSKLITSPYQLLAGNVTGDSKLTAADILSIRKLILGNTSKMENSWIFVPKNYVFENEAKPFAENVPTKVSIDTDNDITTDFYGIKMGDVNNSLSGLELRSGDALILAIDNKNIEEGMVEVPVYANDFSKVNGFQYTVQFDSKVMNFVGIESGEIAINNSNIGTKRIDNGTLTMSWNKVNELTLNSDSPLFTLKFNAKSSAKLQNVLTIGSSVTKQEAYNSNFEVMDVELEYRGIDVFELYQNTPNPFSTYTDISFNLPESTVGTISIYDLTGKELKVITDEFTKGMNSVRINKSDLNVSGVLYYKLETEGFTATKKMILIK